MTRVAFLPEHGCSGGVTVSKIDASLVRSKRSSIAVRSVGIASGIIEMFSRFPDRYYIC